MTDLAKHVLIQQASRFPVRAPEAIVGWRYRRDIGAWVDATSPACLMVDPAPPQSKPRPARPMTKKMDIETGEDMKGE